jgi:putative oxidoreductase
VRIIGAVARPLLSSMFVYGGLDALQHPQTKVKAAEPVAGPLAERVTGVAVDTETLVRLNGAVMVGAGLLLGIGRLRRLASVALIASLLPTTYAGHAFWNEADDATRAQQRIHFLKNLSMLGGLLLAAAENDHKSSRRRKRKAAARTTGPGRISRLGRGATDVLAGAESGLAKLTESSQEQTKRAARVAGDVSRQARQAARPAVSDTADRAARVWNDLSEHLPLP